MSDPKLKQGLVFGLLVDKNVLADRRVMAEPASVPWLPAAATTKIPERAA